ncbi:putative pectinesterase/pectinesterase inhibitor 28 [Phtheirospermum japonicum]|uniref:Pectinesterase n=1 Tax=Phtheirospermum japonicum TaxID=374723 RepID=A0A830D2R2_9LAMI|nr:putative pectinesterase/pectinesterase inhibitor 28 [Phtheirospermum japonicum]
MFSGKNKEETDGGDVSSSQKAITNLCQNTDYKETCVESLQSSGKDTNDPKELIERAFQATINKIKEAAHNSALLQKLENDPRGKSALESCQELADRAANDLQRSLAKFSEFDLTNIDSIMSDLKIWLSGAITYQETCLDGFDDVQGDAGEKMRQFLTKGMQMSSNGLAMVTTTFNSRRLLSESTILGHDDEIPDWMDATRRKLLNASQDEEIKPDLVVAKDGSGNFTTINEALGSIPKTRNTTFVLYIKEGVYKEKVVITSNLTHLLIIGDGPTKTKITGRLNYIDGTNTYQTATVAVQADHFTAKDIGFENSAGAEKHQAVALRVSADLALFFNCQMDGYQDTLYVHTYRQFYRDCVISGTIDFIFGDSAAVFQDCTLVVRKPLSNQNCIVTAQGRKDLRQPTGLVLQNCSFVADPEYYPVRKTNKAYLGRPWKEFSRTVIMESFLDDLIQPEGWLPWNETFALQTLFYTEFNNRGPAASKANRVKWDGVKEVPANRIQRFTADEFIDGKRWVPVSDVPYAGGFIFPVPAEDPNSIYSEVGPEEDKDLNGSFKNKSEFVGRKIPPTNAPTASPGSISAAPEYSHIPASPESHIAASPDSYTAAAPALSPAVSQQPGSFFGLNKFLGGW